MATTPNLQLVELETNQYNAEVTVNDSLKTIDALLLLTVLNMTLTTPPGSPTNGDRYVPAATATGAWVGQENNIAYYYNGWYFISPVVGWYLYDDNTSTFKHWNGTSWVIQDVTGAGSSTDNAIVRFDGTTGKVLQNSGIIISDNAELSGQYSLLQTKSAAYTLTAADCGTTIICNSGSAFNITLPQTTTEAINVGFWVEIINRGAGTITVVKEGTDTIESLASSVNIAQYAQAIVKKVVAGSPNTYSLYGDLS